MIPWLDMCALNIQQYTSYVYNVQDMFNKIEDALSLCYKGCGPHVVTLLDWMLTFESHMARFLVENKYQEDTCHNKIGLCANIVIQT